MTKDEAQRSRWTFYEVVNFMNAQVANIQKSFLFVEEGEISYFIHRNDFEDASEFDQCIVGSILEFEEKQGPKGWVGEKVRLIK
jgi:hypothetical protein